MQIMFISSFVFNDRLVFNHHSSNFFINKVMRRGVTAQSAVWDINSL